MKDSIKDQNWTYGLPENVIALLDILEDSTRSSEEKKKAISQLGTEAPYHPLVLQSLFRVIDSSYAHDIKDLTKKAIEAIQIHKARNLVKIEEKIKPQSPLSEHPAEFISESKSVICKCNFCQSMISLTPRKREMWKEASGAGHFYCGFCLSNNYNTKLSKHVLITSFRAIIGYYYYGLYLNNSKNMSFSQILDIVKNHEEVGLKNPIMKYDPSTHLWFINFHKIGNKNKSLGIDHLLKSTLEIITSFQIPMHIKGASPFKLFKKYQEAFILFYQQRTRPEGSKILSPTMIKTGAPEYSGDKIYSPFLPIANYNTADVKRKIQVGELKSFILWDHLPF